MKKNIRLLLIAAPALLLALFTTTLLWQRSLLPEVTLRIAGYDPRDLLSGHYIAYTIDWENTDCTQFAGNHCPRDEFARSSIDGRWGKYHRFYIPEENAELLDSLFRQASENLVFEVVYGYAPNFRPQIKRLLINGRNWDEYLGEETNTAGDNERPDNTAQNTEQDKKNSPLHSANTTTGK